MPTKFEKLDADNWHSLHRLAGALYLDGQCYEFAVALHRGLGWQLVGLIQEKIIRHALVRGPHGTLHDVRGEVSLENAGQPFVAFGACVLEDITEAEMIKQRPISEYGVDRASLSAQALWPELPWKDESFKCKVLSFMAEFEELCRKHRVWIRAPHPSVYVVLSQMVGDEGGYKIGPSLDGQYFFDRYLE